MVYLSIMQSDLISQVRYCMLDTFLFSNLIILNLWVTDSGYLATIYGYLLRQIPFRRPPNMTSADGRISEIIETS